MMEGFLVSGYAAIAIALFAVFRLPLNRWTVPAATFGGLLTVFALTQVLNFYHPHSGSSRQQPSAPEATAQAPGLVAWFSQNQQARLLRGSAAEVTFAGIPGRVFGAEVRGILMPAGGDDNAMRPVLNDGRVPVLLAITDEAYPRYAPQIPAGSTAQASVYGNDWPQLALLRKTLLRMSAWMNYLSLPV